jgi:beta-lactam-binding protein with PASTA domain
MFRSPLTSGYICGLSDAFGIRSEETDEEGRFNMSLAVDQSPEAGEIVPRSAKVQIDFVRYVERLYPTPEFVGLLVDNANAEAAANGFTLALVDRGRTITTKNPLLDGSKGIVDQAPQAGTRTSRRRPVAVEAARLVYQLAVPDVVGKPVDEATAVLERAGLRATVNYGGGADGAESVVIAQDPVRGSRVRQGTSVILTTGNRKTPPPLGGGGVF